MAGTLTACTIVLSPRLCDSSVTAARTCSSGAVGLGLIAALMISTPASASFRTCSRAVSGVLKLAGSARPDVTIRGPLSIPESIRRFSSTIPGTGPPPDMSVVYPASRNSCIR